MAEVSLTAAFSTVPTAEAEEIKRVIVETVQQIALDDGTFKRAKLVFTESDERCGLTAELDGGLGLGAAGAPGAGARVGAPDSAPEAGELTRANALVTGGRGAARLGDCYTPVGGERSALICTTPPQMPTPPGRARNDPVA